MTSGRVCWAARPPTPARRRAQTPRAQMMPFAAAGRAPATGSAATHPGDLYTGDPGRWEARWRCTRPPPDELAELVFARLTHGRPEHPPYVLDRQRWTTRAELRLAIVSWIETTYRRRRRRRRPADSHPPNLRHSTRSHPRPEPPHPRVNRTRGSPHQCSSGRGAVDVDGVDPVCTGLGRRGVGVGCEVLWVSGLCDAVRVGPRRGLR